MALGARRAFIVGLSGTVLSSEERAMLAGERPCGIIIFTRNFADNAQLLGLISEARDAVGSNELLVLVDQEGGRVQRLRGPEWSDFPPAAAFGALYQEDPSAALQAAEVASQWLAGLLRGVGINTNCVPCLDVPVPGADAIIGDRAYADTPAVVAEFGRAVATGCINAGVLPVMKHIPGHGRAGVDSHLALPVVETDRATLESSDFAPFKANADLPAAMSAHVTYTAIDSTAPASTSPRVTGDVIRGAIGFDGLLMSDDVSMQALSGSLAERAAAVVEAGSDVVLHCNGDYAEMRAVADVAPELAGNALARYQRCLEVVRRQPKSVTKEALNEALNRVQGALA